MRSAKEAVAYLKKVHTLVRYLEICDGNMQEGSFRCDANVSVRVRGTEKFGTRAEIKNLNSFRFVEKAINYEVARQIELLEGGGKVVQETRLYDSDSGETRSMRSKEEANDYRYFPDPDLLPLEIDQAYIDAVCASLPELPDQKAQRFIAAAWPVGLRCRRADRQRELADYYETVSASDSRRCGQATPKLAANTVIGELSGLLNRDGLDIAPEPYQRRRARRPAAARRRQHHLRQDRQGRARGDVGRRHRRRRDHQGARPAADHRRVGDRAGDRRGHGRQSRRSWPTIAPARTNCSASSSDRS